MFYIWVLYFQEIDYVQLKNSLKIQWQWLVKIILLNILFWENW